MPFRSAPSAFNPDRKIQDLRWGKDEDRLPEDGGANCKGKSIPQKGTCGCKRPHLSHRGPDAENNRVQPIRGLSGKREVVERGRRMRSEGYFGTRPSWASRTKMRTLNHMWSERGSQWSCWAMNVEMWENRGRWTISLAAALSTARKGDR